MGSALPGPQIKESHDGRLGNDFKPFEPDLHDTVLLFGQFLIYKVSLFSTKKL